VELDALGVREKKREGPGATVVESGGRRRWRLHGVCGSAEHVNEGAELRGSVPRGMNGLALRSDGLGGGLVVVDAVKIAVAAHI